MECSQSCVQIIITEAGTPHETENYWEKEEVRRKILRDKKAAENVSSDELEQVRREAEHIVERVISKASEIVQNGDVPHSHIKEEKENIPQEEDEIGEEEDEKMDDISRLMKRDPELVEKAKTFVCELLEKAVEEANRRLEMMSVKNSEEICLEENMETGSTPSDGTKRKPWYRRASTSVCQFFHRMCICMRSRNHR